MRWQNRSADDFISDTFRITYDEFDTIDVGRAPEKPGEVMLRVPISYQTRFGKDELRITRWDDFFYSVDYTITGVDYYYDNTKTPQVIFTKEGYELASALAIYYNPDSVMGLMFDVLDKDGETMDYTLEFKSHEAKVSFDIPENSYYIVEQELKESLQKVPGYTMKGTFNGMFMNRYYSESAYGNNEWGTQVYYEEELRPVGYGENEMLEYALPKLTEATEIPADISLKDAALRSVQMVIPATLIQKFIEDEYCKKAYAQASLFYKNDREAEKAAAKLNKGSYIAVASNEYRTENSMEKILVTIAMAIQIFMWFVGVSFAALFLSLCSSRAMLATRGDVAILRSMGIPAKVVRVSIYFQTMLALIPAYIVTAIVCVIIFRTPKTSENFVFLPPFVYVILFFAMLLMAFLLSKRYVKKMFDESVKKTMRGGAEA